MSIRRSREFADFVEFVQVGDKVVVELRELRIAWSLSRAGNEAGFFSTVYREIDDNKPNIFVLLAHTYYVELFLGGALILRGLQLNDMCVLDEKGKSLNLLVQHNIASIHAVGVPKGEAVQYYEQLAKARVILFNVSKLE